MAATPRPNKAQSKPPPLAAAQTPAAAASPASAIAMGLPQATTKWSVGYSFIGCALEVLGCGEVRSRLGQLPDLGELGGRDVECIVHDLLHVLAGSRDQGQIEADGFGPEVRIGQHGPEPGAAGRGP